ncbi:DUF6268 family outer membrane beta-barrel protein [Pseudohalioglobus lutimaris]|uniref:DUF6268 domain-containing protein n=1 Tax=Pseudohalioglobus lutimaris TaxID=1737061 RepID=A0A2N5X248_9GAMM|nr:DUF6268 family outer membrane beta-barrel protein [Pseudohalioglobus lutimaris]PLW68556.1 hypothetical protein C0039_12350 [Pseudohalioglobus lutimaris]
MAIACSTLVAAPLAVAGDEEPGLVQQAVARFEASDFEFQRSISNAPFPPLAFLSVASYSNVEAESSAGRSLEYDVNRISQMAAVPFLLGKRDALIVGEYLSVSEFNVDSDEFGDVRVSSVGLPVGWMRQANPDWQLAALVMPLGHNSDLKNSDWDWQYLGGAFSRYVQDETLWWAFGLYFDVGSGDDTYLPYLGASWSINERWTLSAVMPWPAVIYSPGPDWMLRLGAAPSGASWSLDLEDANVGVNLDSWDFGLTGEYRVAGNFWLGAEAGVGGMRGLRLNDGDVEEPEVDFSSNAYLRFTVKFRPGARI